MSVPAGSSVITAADITDTRADEAVCGVMRDGVTGIPTEQLVAQWQAAQAAQMAQGTEKLDRLEQSIRNLDNGSFYTKQEADRKFGTPYSLPPATADQLGGVKVGEALDIAPDGTLSAKTLNDKIAAAVAVKSEPRLVWTTTASTGTKWKTLDVQVPDGVDYVHVIKGTYDGSSDGEIDLARGGVITYLQATLTFQTNGILHVKNRYNSDFNDGYELKLWLSGYHYPTLADLLTQVTAVESSVTDLQVALCELYEEKEEN